MRHGLALVFPLFLVVFAALYYFYHGAAGAPPQQLGANAGEGGPPGPRPILLQLKRGENYTLELKLVAGDRPTLSVDSTGVVDVYVFESREWEKFVGGSRARAAYEYPNTTRLVTALPVQYDVVYVVYIKAVEDAEVAVELKSGKIDEATRIMRLGGEVLRAFHEVEVKGRHVAKIALFSPGTRLELKYDGEGTVAVLWFSDYRKYIEGTPLDRLCSADNCLRGSGELKIVSDSFDDAYIVVEGAGRLAYALVATPELLLKVGTCG